MPSEHQSSQSHMQTRPSLTAGHRSNSSVNNDTDSPAGTPPQHGRTKSAKHVVGAGRAHARVSSNKGLHKLTKGHTEGSHTDLKKLGKQSSSSTNLKKNSSHVSLKRNRSSADVQKRPRSAHGQEKKAAAVHFEIGDQEEVDAWEEASNLSSASPALSRSASKSAASSGQSSAKPSANNSRPQSPPHSPLPPSITKAPVPAVASANGANEANDKQNNRHSVDAKVITERLLQRTHSHHNTTKMSLTTATPDGHSPESPTKSQSSTLNSTPQTGSNEIVSRFVGGSGTPSEHSPFLHNRSRSDAPPKATEEVKRAQSMGNLTRLGDSDEESALAPRSRKSSQSSNYNPPPQSRTQQKLWLQRASSNIEPAQMAPGVALNGLSGIHGGFGGTSLVSGAGYDGRDPRIKLQLEKTGLEYLVVRRYQDPVGKALKRLHQLPGAEKDRRIPHQRTESTGTSRYGLSQSLQSRGRGGGKDRSSPATTNGVGSYDGQGSSHDDTGISDRANDDEGVGAILQSMWQKSFDLSASAD